MLKVRLQEQLRYTVVWETFGTAPEKSGCLSIETVCK